ncbi:hypothetical protein ACIQMR_16520 [Streptomyces sp. NPDC091376]|uniref:hypothetical protein n=1 Tax=Streptomyces sp. NPDC091376 TaxID=3365994 RepID=UPI003829502E
MTPTSTSTALGRVAAPAPKQRTARRLAALVAAAQLAMVLTACQEPEDTRSFSVPSDLCGTPVPAAALDAVLPKSGKTLEARASSREVGRTHCEVVVNDALVLSAFSEWKKGDSLTKVAGSNPYIDLGEHTSEDGTYTWSNQGGVRLIPCPVAAKAHPERDLFIRVLIYDKKFSDTDAAKKLLLAYAKSVADSAACKGSAS